MENPLITTIIPTFKRPHLLKRALASVVKQTYTQFQVCVYDNASNDETKEVVQEFIKTDSRVKYFCHPQNIGMMANYQYALSRVTTPFFSLLSDDDLLFPCFYEATLRGFSQFPEAFFSATSAIIMTPEKKIIRVPLDLWEKEGFFSPPDSLYEMISRYPVPTCIIFRREVLDHTTIDAANCLVWDCDFLLQIASRFPIFVSKEPTGIFMQHTSSFSSSQSYALWRNSFNKLKENFINRSTLSKQITNNCVCLFDREIKQIDRGSILSSLFKKNFKKSFIYALRYKKNHRTSILSYLFLLATLACLIFPPALYFILLLKKIRSFFLKKPLPSNNISLYERHAKDL